jgi:hypothetical protein
MSDEGPPEELTARDAVERNARAIQAGDMQRIMMDLTPEAFTKAMQMLNQQGGGAGTPRQVTSFEIEERGVEGEDYLFHVRYHAPEGQLTMHSRWREIGADWKAADFGILDAQAAAGSEPQAAG